ncbi:MAG TPA: hypothetical protein VFO58_08975 [Vicinamibacterales bacterium]|nr:hypothetical protein [Vicinamibacterales bacterium]
MKLFTPKKHEPPRAGTDVVATLAEITQRLEKLERVITDLKQNVDLLPAVVRKLYLDGVELTPPYDLIAERFSYLSQNDEDGLILAIFKRIGTTDRRFVEIGCGMNGGNSGFLAQECGWSGLMMDNRPDAIEKVRTRFTGHQVTVRLARVSRENVDALLAEHGMTGELDLLCIDIDGNDYWVWDAITACRPRVVSIEYNWLFGASRPVTIPYDESFDLATVGVRAYRGASLAALVHLATRKGYRLVATERVNAFFLRTDVGPEWPALDPARGYRAPMNIAHSRDVFTKIRNAGLPLLNVVTGESET